MASTTQAYPCAHPGCTLDCQHEGAHLGFGQECDCHKRSTK